MTFLSTIDIQELNDFPIAAFKGNIEVVDSLEAMTRALTQIHTWPVIGIDTETRPSFTKGQHFKVALLQVCSMEQCFLFRLNVLGLPGELVALLQNPRITKIGLSLKDDFMMLRKRASVEPQGYVDLQEYVSRFGIMEKSLQKIYAILFGEKISKTQRLSNWEAEELSDKQQLYAATDAWACLKIYNYLIHLESDAISNDTSIS